MSTPQFKSLICIYSNPLQAERSDNETIEMYSLSVLLWSTNGLQLKGGWMDHIINYYYWQGIIFQENQYWGIIEINLSDILCNEGVLPIELSLLISLDEMFAAYITTL